jgi:hypothetical protein
MAVLPGCHGVKVEVIVDDQALHEYDDNSDTPPSPGTVTKYVEATSGSEFATHLMFTRGYPYQVGDVEKLIYLDGKVVESYIVSPKAFFHPAQHFVDGRCAYVGSAVVLQKFRFTELSIGRSIIPHHQAHFRCVQKLMLSQSRKVLCFVTSTARQLYSLWEPSQSNSVTSRICALLGETNFPQAART